MDIFKNQYDVLIHSINVICDYTFSTKHAFKDVQKKTHLMQLSVFAMNFHIL